MALLTTAQVTARMPHYSGTSQNTLIDKLVGACDGLFASYCGRPLASGALAPSFETATYVRRLDGPRRMQPRALDLGLRPLISVTSVFVDSAWDFAASTAATEGTDFEADLEAGILWTRSDASTVWIRSPRSIKATVVAGFATPLADTHLFVELAAATVQHLLDRPATQGRRSISTGGTTFQPDDLDELLPQKVRNALGPYVLWGNRAG